MLDGYVSEKEQIDAIRKWWRDNGKLTITAIFFGLLVGFGWRYWHTLEIRRAENASVVYQSVLMADSKKDYASAKSSTALLTKDFANSPYTSLAAMIVAKEAVEQNDLQTASTQLQWVIDHGNPARLQDIARLSLSRILVSENKTDVALATLKGIKDKSFLPLVNWVKGDVYTKEGNAKEAQSHYTAAKNALSEFPPAVKLLNQAIAQPIG